MDTVLGAGKAKYFAATTAHATFSSHSCDVNVTESPFFAVTMTTGMESQVHGTGIMGKQPLVSRAKEVIDLDEVSKFIAGLRGWVDPFALASWVVEEAERLCPSTRLDEAFDEKRECNPSVILTVLAYSYVTGVFSSEEIVRNCRINAAFGALAGGKFLFRHELTHFRRRHRTLLMELVARVFVRAVSEWFALGPDEIAPYLDSDLRRVAIERLDIARHLDAVDEC